MMMYFAEITQGRIYMSEYKGAIKNPENKSPTLKEYIDKEIEDRFSKMFINNDKEIDNIIKNAIKVSLEDFISKL